MSIKGYIALFMVTVFMAKFTAVNANGLNFLFNDSGIAFVNFHCKKDNGFHKKTVKLPVITAQVSSLEVIALNSDCTTPFKLELFTWEAKQPLSIMVHNDYLTSKLRYMYLDSVSPPPCAA
ncbi:hypothetical protein ES677_06660 [Bizionia gelidisalsuginis]|uniref:Uncharacterized protein n=1 Tax=Bizionia gelidisalsuginis TaxID=291188 RepID=A0ABY3MBR4_9FLAO|nr:hypothetical protein [Bizionia gelidisalsuginis]TYC14215.1 hypothetical protein ES677_06660 [Bizionia gelidisalsuginis]